MFLQEEGVSESFKMIDHSRPRPITYKAKYRFRSNSSVDNLVPGKNWDLATSSSSSKKFIDL